LNIGAQKIEQINEKNSYPNISMDIGYLIRFCQAFRSAYYNVCSNEGFKLRDALRAIIDDLFRGHQITYFNNENITRKEQIDMFMEDLFEDFPQEEKLSYKLIMNQMLLEYNLELLASERDLYYLLVDKLCEYFDQRYPQFLKRSNENQHNILNNNSSNTSECGTSLWNFMESEKMDMCLIGNKRTNTNLDDVKNKKRTKFNNFGLSSQE